MSRLPQPSQWRDRNVLVVLGLALFAASGIAAAVMAVDRLLRGEYLTAVILVGGAVFCLAATVAGVRGRFVPTPLRIQIDSTGTVLLPDLIGTRLVGITYASAIPAGLLYVIFVPQGVVDLPLSRGQQIFSPILIAMLVFYAARGLTAMVRRRGLGRIRLDTSGVEVVDALSTRQVQWADVIDVTDHTSDTNVRRPIVLVLKDAKPVVINNASGFVPDGAALYWMVRHYWRHPEDRDELEDGRALDRLRNEQFAVD